MYENIKLFRKRFIPNECVLLKDDKIIQIDEDVIITHWTTLKPKFNFKSGKSCVYIKHGFKISNLFDENNNYVSTYCDIINVKKNNNEYVIEDLLADVIIENGKVKVMDLDEIPLALDNNLITIEIAKDALIKLNSLLNIIYEDRLDEFIDLIR